jgi:putative ABC transport system ATP-binding protein
MSTIITFKNITKVYQVGEEQVHALDGISMHIQKNEYVAIMGPSGSGKSTMMNIVGCLDTPTSGLYELNGTNVSDMDDDDLAKIRNKEIGFVFQTFNLLGRSDVLHNVELPLIYGGIGSAERKKLARAAIERVGWSETACSSCTRIGYSTGHFTGR